jgi:hypothetical protein
MNDMAWTGTVSSVLGSFLVAFGIYLAGYIAFLVGASCWLGVALYRRDRALALLNGTFWVANVIGLWRAF